MDSHRARGRPHAGISSSLIGAFSVVAFYALLQCFALDPEGALTGDQGTKRLQTLAVVQHGPLTPWIDGPEQEIDPEPTYREPFLLKNARNQRVVGIFPWIFPALTAPFYAMVGALGLYVVPAVSVAVVFLAIKRLGVRSHPTLAAACAVFATPVLFYGAEFWEHAPAVALTTAAIVSVASGLSASKSRTVHLISGALLGLAGWFRPEADIMCPAGVAGLFFARGAGAAFASAWLIAGWIAVKGAALPLDHVVYGTYVAPQVWLNLSSGASGYLSGRVEMLRSLILPAWPHSFVFVAAFLTLALVLMRAAAVERWSTMDAGDAEPPEPSSFPGIHWFLRVLRCTGGHILVVVGIGVAVVVPVWRTWVDSLPWYQTFHMDSVAHTWVFALAAIYPVHRLSREPSDVVERFLAATALAFVIGALLVMPHAGGGQWGARFLLPAAPLVALLSVRRLGTIGHERGRRSVAVGVASVLIVSAGVQLFGIRQLASFRSMNGLLVSKIETRTQPGDVIVSDLLWVPQLMSRLYPVRQLLWAASAEDLTAIAQRAGDRRRSRMFFVTSAVEGSYPMPQRIPLRGGDAYVRSDVENLVVRSIVLARYEDRAAQDERPALRKSRDSTTPDVVSTVFVVRGAGLEPSAR